MITKDIKYIVLELGYEPKKELLKSFMYVISDLDNLMMGRPYECVTDWLARLRIND